MTNKEIYIVVAVDENDGIGKNGKLPWSFKKEIAYFKNLTTTTNNPNNKNIVIMGRKTWESIDLKYRPLKNRINVILTKNKDFKAEGAKISSSIEEALSFADNQTEKIFIIGGATLFNETINLPGLTGIYLTRIESKYDCDTYFPTIPNRFSNKKELGSEEENGIKYKFFLYSQT
ncbi:dihydrofolate reductase [Candidatus Peregrinibacteria bacterium]|nr:dihydrofolate reductase [Candidatus Peregrinibacteria bacterium]